jgi:hypothetical protein
MHPWGLLAADGFIATTIYARETLLAYVIFRQRLDDELSAIRRADRSCFQDVIWANAVDQTAAGEENGLAFRK